MLKALDRKIIEKLTKFSHWFQKLTGLTCYFFAKLGLFIVLHSLVIRAMNYFSPIITAHSSPIDILLLFFFGYLSAVEMCALNRAQENNTQGQVKVGGFSRQFRMFLWIFLMYEMYFLVFSIRNAPFKLLEILAYVGFPFGTLFFCYFIEVTPLPPGKSKVRQWIEGFFSVQPKLQPIPIKSDE